MELPLWMIATLRSSWRFLGPFVPMLAAGIIAAEVLVALGWMRRLAWLGRPLTALGHLPDECAVSFVTAFMSPAAANAMLVRHHQNGIIDRRALIATAIVNTFPGVILHWRTVLPAALPLIGRWGLVYYGLLVLVGLLKTVVVALTTRLLLAPPDKGRREIPPGQESRLPLGQLLGASLRRSWRPLWRILSTAVPMALAAFALIESGVFVALERHLDFVLDYLPLAPAALAVVAARVVSNVGAFAVAGGLLTAGQLGGRDVVLALLVGNLLATGLNLRYLVPYYLGIFGPRLGVQVLAMSTLLRLAVMVVVITAVARLWA